MLQLFSQYSGMNLISAIIAFSIAVIFAFTVHEFAHAFVADRLGDGTPKASGRLTFNPGAHIDATGFIFLMIFGFGWAKPVPINSNNFKNRKSGSFFVAIAGVATNLLIAFLIYPIYILVLKSAGADLNNLMFFTVVLISFIIEINLMLFIINLIPIYPLDGFRIIESFTSPYNKFVIKMKENSFAISIIILLILYFTNVFGYLLGNLHLIIDKFWSLII